ncbi:hypothetical protein [uncultured Croceitalea sp.]|uniref:hypothetical protein n=1 Tax=uncultured Croceitalea sp. TaxID=1798908 RepID=UPI00374E320E
MKITKTIKTLSKIKISLFNIIVFLIILITYLREKNSVLDIMRVKEIELEKRQSELLKRELEFEYLQKTMELNRKEQYVNDKLTSLQHKLDLTHTNNQIINQYKLKGKADEELKSIIREIGINPSDLHGNYYRFKLFSAIAKEHDLQDKYDEFIETSYRLIVLPYGKKHYFNTVRSIN